MMWNWKMVFDDDACAFYCDVDLIVDTVGDAEGTYPSTECYMPTPDRFGVWTSLSFKDKEIVKRYVAERKRMGLRIKGYEGYQYSLCLVEFDSRKMKYRIIPAMDYNAKDDQIGDSFLFGDGAFSLIDGLSGEWAGIRSRKTHPMIKALHKMFSSSVEC